MPAPFVLTAEIRLRAPKNVRQVVRNMQRQLSGVKANVDVKVPKGSARNLKQVGNNISAVGRNAKTASKQTKSFGQALKGTLGYLMRYDAARMIINAVTQTIRESTKAAVDFEREMVKVSQVTGQSMKSLKGLERTITNLSTSMGVSSSSLVKTAKTLAQTGMIAKDVEYALSALAKTTLAPTFDDIKNTTETAIAAMRQFGIEAKDLERELGRINALAANFAVEASDIGVAIRRAGGAFKSAGGNLMELEALFTSVRATTRETAETIATGFRTIFTRMQRPKTIQFMRQLGIELQDMQGHFVGPYEAVRKLNVALSQLDPRDVRYSQIVEQLGGFRQVSKVIPMIQQFATAQKALTVAQAGGKSLTDDAVKAQQALAVQLEKVREEFRSLFRELMASKGFQSMIKMALDLSRAIIKITDALAPLIPMLGTIVAAKGVAMLGGKGMGVMRGKASGGRVHAFAQGGLVPGRGNRDTVPAMLTPGEFVIKKSSVKKLGVNNLANANRYVAGGTVKMNQMKTQRIGAHVAKPGSVTWDKDTKTKFGSKGKAHKFEKEDTINFTGHQEIRPRLDESKFGKKGTGFRGDLRTFFTSKNKFKRGDAWESLLIKGAAGTKLVPKPDKRFGPRNSPLDGKWNGRRADAALTSKSHKDFQMADKLIADEINYGAKLAHQKGRLRRNEKGKFDTVTTTKSYEIIGENASRQEQAWREAVQPSTKKVGTKTGKAPKVLREATGGHISGAGTDTVPALLTPGEFVINRESASRIGYGNLNRMNSFARFKAGGRVHPKHHMYAAPFSVRDPFIAAGKDMGGGGKSKSSGGGGGMQLMALMMAIPLLTSHLEKSTGKVRMLGDGINALLPWLAGGATLLMLFGDGLKSATAATFANSKAAGAGAAAGLALVAVTYGVIKAQEAAAKRQREGALKGLETGFKSAEGIDRERRKFRAGQAGVEKAGSAQTGMFVGAGLAATIAGIVLTLIPEPTSTAAGLAIIAGAAGVGAGVGGGIGHAVGGGSPAMAEFEEKLRKLKIGVRLETFARGLKLVSEGASSPRAQAAVISSGMEALTKSFAHAAKDQDVEDLTGQIKKAVPGMVNYISKLEQTVRSFDQLQRIVGKKTLRQFAQLSGFSLDDLERRIQSNIEIRKKAAAAQKEQLEALEQLTRRMRFARAAVAAFALIEQRLKSFDSVLDSTSQSIKNMFGPALIGQLAPAFADLTKIVDMSVFRKQVDSVASVFGGAGADLGRELKEIATVSSALPGILIQSVNEIGIAGDTAGDVIVDKFEAAGIKISDAMKRQLRARISSLSDTGEGGVGKFRKKIQQDLDGTVKNIIKGMAESHKAFVEAAKFIDSANKRMAKAFDMRTKLEVEMAKKQSSIIALMSENFKRIRAAQGKPTGLGFEQASFENQQGALLQGTGIAGFGGNLQVVSAEFLRLKEEIAKSNARLAKFGLEPGMAMGNLVNSQKALLNQNAKLKEQFAKTHQVLQNYTNIQQRIGNIQKRIADEAAKRQTMLNAMTQFAFANDKSRIDIMKAFQATTIAVNKGLGAIPEQMRPAVLGVLDQFKNVQIFGGKTGKEVKADLTIREMERVFGKMPKELKKEILEATQEEDNLIREMTRIQKEAETAQKTLLQGMAQDRKRLAGDIRQLHSELVDGLKSIFLKQEEKQLTEQINETKASRAVATRGTNAIEFIQRQGINVKDTDTLNALRDNMSTIKAAAEARNKFAKLQIAKRQLSSIGDFEGVGPFGKGGEKFERRLDQIRENLIGKGTGRDTADQIVSDMRKSMQSALASAGGEGITSTDLSTLMQSAFGTTVARLQAEQKSIYDENAQRLGEIGIGRFADGLIKSEAAFDAVAKALQNIPPDATWISLQEELNNTTIALIRARRELATNEKERKQVDANLKAAKPKAAGGVIYAAEGTFVPRGTDTVPAMLTPGEFVVNRKAASSNMGILNSINSGGAQYFAGGGAVLHKAGPASPQTAMQDWIRTSVAIPTAIMDKINYFTDKSVGIPASMFSAVAGEQVPWRGQLSNNKAIQLSGDRIMTAVPAAGEEGQKKGMEIASRNYQKGKSLSRATEGAMTGDQFRSNRLKAGSMSRSLANSHQPGKLPYYISFPPHMGGANNATGQWQQLANGWSYWVGHPLGQKGNSRIEKGWKDWKEDQTTVKRMQKWHHGKGSSPPIDTKSQLVDWLFNIEPIGTRRDHRQSESLGMAQALRRYHALQQSFLLKGGIKFPGMRTARGPAFIGNHHAELPMLTTTNWLKKGWWSMLPPGGEAYYAAFSKHDPIAMGPKAVMEKELFGGTNIFDSFKGYVGAQSEYYRHAGRLYPNYIGRALAEKGTRNHILSYHRGDVKGKDMADWLESNWLFDFNNPNPAAFGQVPLLGGAHTKNVRGASRMMRQVGVAHRGDYRSLKRTYGPGGPEEGIFKGLWFNPRRWHPNMNKNTNTIARYAAGESKTINQLFGNLIGWLRGKEGIVDPGRGAREAEKDADGLMESNIFTELLGDITSYLGLGTKGAEAPLDFHKKQQAKKAKEGEKKRAVLVKFQEKQAAAMKNVKLANVGDAVNQMQKAKRLMIKGQVGKFPIPTYARKNLNRAGLHGAGFHQIDHGEASFEAMFPFLSKVLEDLTSLRGGNALLSATGGIDPSLKWDIPTMVSTLYDKDNKLRKWPRLIGAQGGNLVEQIFNTKGGNIGGLLRTWAKDPTDGGWYPKTWSKEEQAFSNWIFGPRTTGVVGIIQKSLETMHAEVKQSVEEKRAGKAAVGKAQGGVIRMADGGQASSIFVPRGTDTVPAMLTPGEFVIRKSAVDQVGVGFLQAINNGGAGSVRGFSKGGVLYAQGGSHVMTMRGPEGGGGGLGAFEDWKLRHWRAIFDQDGRHVKFQTEKWDDLSKIGAEYHDFDLRPTHPRNLKKKEQQNRDRAAFAEKYSSQIREQQSLIANRAIENKKRDKELAKLYRQPFGKQVRSWEKEKGIAPHERDRLIDFHRKQGTRQFIPSTLAPMSMPGIFKYGPGPWGRGALRARSFADDLREAKKQAGEVLGQAMESQIARPLRMLESAGSGTWSLAKSVGNLSGAIWTGIIPGGADTGYDVLTDKNVSMNEKYRNNLKLELQNVGSSLLNMITWDQARRSSGKGMATDIPVLGSVEQGLIETMSKLGHEKGQASKNREREERRKERERRGLDPEIFDSIESWVDFAGELSLDALIPIPHLGSAANRVKSLSKGATWKNWFTRTNAGGSKTINKARRITKARTPRSVTLHSGLPIGDIKGIIKYWEDYFTRKKVSRRLFGQNIVPLTRTQKLAKKTRSAQLARDAQFIRNAQQGKRGFRYEDVDLWPPGDVRREILKRHANKPMGHVHGAASVVPTVKGPSTTLPGAGGGTHLGQRGFGPPVKSWRGQSDVKPSDLVPHHTAPSVTRGRKPTRGEYPPTAQGDELFKRDLAQWEKQPSAPQPDILTKGDLPELQKFFNDLESSTIGSKKTPKTPKARRDIADEAWTGGKGGGFMGWIRKWLGKKTFSQGGFVSYLAGGGPLSFGTDTVPAMLTPGEFVVSKKAVDQVGVGFLKDVNSGNFAAGGMVSYLQDGGAGRSGHSGIGGSPFYLPVHPEDRLNYQGYGFPPPPSRGARRTTKSPYRFKPFGYEYEVIPRAARWINPNGMEDRKPSHRRDPDDLGPRRKRELEFNRQGGAALPAQPRESLFDRTKRISSMASGGLVSYLRHGDQVHMAFAHDYSEEQYAQALANMSSGRGADLVLGPGQYVPQARPRKATADGRPMDKVWQEIQSLDKAQQDAYVRRARAKHPYVPQSQSTAIGRALSAPMNWLHDQVTEPTAKGIGTGIDVADQLENMVMRTGMAAGAAGMAGLSGIGRFLQMDELGAGTSPGEWLEHAKRQWDISQAIGGNLEAGIGDLLQGLTGFEQTHGYESNFIDRTEELTGLDPGSKGERVTARYGLLVTGLLKAGKEGTKWLLKGKVGRQASKTIAEDAKWAKQLQKMMEQNQASLNKASKVTKASKVRPQDTGKIHGPGLPDSPHGPDTLQEALKKIKDELAGGETEDLLSLVDEWGFYPDEVMHGDFRTKKPGFGLEQVELGLLEMALNPPKKRNILQKILDPFIDHMVGPKKGRARIAKRERDKFRLNLIDQMGEGDTLPLPSSANTPRATIDEALEELDRLFPDPDATSVLDDMPIDPDGTGIHVPKDPDETGIHIPKPITPPKQNIHTQWADDILRRVREAQKSGDPTHVLTESIEDALKRIHDSPTLDMSANTGRPLRDILHENAGNTEIHDTLKMLAEYNASVDDYKLLDKLNAEALFRENLPNPFSGSRATLPPQPSGPAQMIQELIRKSKFPDPQPQLYGKTKPGQFGGTGPYSYMPEHMRPGATQIPDPSLRDFQKQLDDVVEGFGSSDPKYLMDEWKRTNPDDPSTPFSHVRKWDPDTEQFGDFYRTETGEKQWFSNIKGQSQAELDSILEQWLNYRKLSQQGITPEQIFKDQQWMREMEDIGAAPWFDYFIQGKSKMGFDEPPGGYQANLPSFEDTYHGVPGKVEGKILWRKMTRMHEWNKDNPHIGGIPYGTKPSRNARGGLIRGYENGGSVFTPQGTDTVPAMLTPGEFVIQKAAVDAVGTSFLNAINSAGGSKPRGYRRGGGVEYLQNGGQPGPGGPMVLDSSKFDKAVQDFSTVINTDLKSIFDGGFAFNHSGSINVIVSFDESAQKLVTTGPSVDGALMGLVNDQINTAFKERLPDLPQVPSSTFNFSSDTGLV